MGEKKKAAGQRREGDNKKRKVERLSWVSRQTDPRRSKYVKMAIKRILRHYALRSGRLTLVRAICKIQGDGIGMRANEPRICAIKTLPPTGAFA